MTIPELISKTMTNIVDRDNTIAETVEYKPVNGKAEEIKVIPEYGEWEKDEKNEMVSKVIFHLSTRKPKYGDSVIHDGTRYTVLGYKQVGDRYDIITETRQHKSGRSR